MFIGNLSTITRVVNNQKATHNQPQNQWRKEPPNRTFCRSTRVTFLFSSARSDQGSDGFEDVFWTGGNASGSNGGEMEERKEDEFGLFGLHSLLEDLKDAAFLPNPSLHEALPLHAVEDCDHNQPFLSPETGSFVSIQRSEPFRRGSLK